MKCMSEKIRKTILYFLENARSHPTADEIFNYIRSNLGEINLEDYQEELEILITEKKIIIALIINNKKHYETRIEKHYHFICQTCGSVKDVFMKLGAVDMITDHAQKIMNSYAKVDKVNMSFQGICHQCRKK